MLNKILVFILLVTSCVYSQKPQYDFKAAELKSRQLIYADPKAALEIIKKTLSQKGKLHDTIYGNTYNLYGMYYGMTGDPDSSIYYFEKSIGYLAKYPKNRVRTILNKAIGYRNRGDYKTSIKLLNESLVINRKEKNNIGIAIAYGELASNYNYMLDYPKSVDYLLKAIEILKAEKNVDKLVAIKQKLANTYLRMQNFKFASDLYRECMVDFKATGARKNYLLTQVNLAEALIQMKDLKGAQKELESAVVGLEEFGDKELIGITHSKIGNIQYMQGQTAKAITSYQMAVDRLLQTQSSRVVRIGAEYISLLVKAGNYPAALKIVAAVEATGKAPAANIEDRMMYLSAIADAYSKTNNDKKAIDSYNKTIMLMDSIAARDRDNAVQEIQAKFQTELQREKNIALESRNVTLQEAVATEKRMMLLYVAISIVIIIMILSFLRAYWLKSRLQNVELKTIEAEKTLIKQQHEHEHELTNAQREIIEEKQRELTSMALRMANYQDSLNEVIEKCDANVFSKASEVKKELQQLIKRKDYWKQFETRFNRLHP
ncbi:MAG: tetratricopeptide repeat protein, partial [Flavobacterium sp.]